MYLGKADVNTYSKGAGREFLISNGQGSYGFSTVVGANTRKEHGLLVVRPKEQSFHRVLFSRMEETLFCQGKKYQLSTNRYRDLVYPDGFRYVQEYHASPIPTMLFVVHGLLLRKSLFMPMGKGCTVIKYELMSTHEKVRLELRPLVAHRMCNEIISHESSCNFKSSEGERNIQVEGRGMKSYLSFSTGEWTSKPLWYDHLLYENEETLTPEDSAIEDLWSPGQLQVHMSEGDCLYVVMSSDDEAFTFEQLKALEEETIQYLQNMVDKSPLDSADAGPRDLVLASHHLVDEGKSGNPAIFTGYPSVQNRARETFIALPGLTIATGRCGTGIDILRRWAALAQSQDWLMPGSVDPAGGVTNDGADAGLWFLYAAQKVFGELPDTGGTMDLWQASERILSRIIRGTPFLELHDNGLLYMQREHAATQWMNGSVGDDIVVCRYGYLVDINALWYNALCFGARLAEVLGDKEKAASYEKAASKVFENFENTFRSSCGKYLYDWMDKGGINRDDSIRPNQILAVSLPKSPISAEMGQKVLSTCWNDLYTTYGLRTLDPKHEKFKGRCEGRPDQRIKARYRGMAWPWLLGHFISAYMRFNPARTDIGTIFVRPFTAHMRHGCLAGVAEYFDGLMPYNPHGDVISATSMGEVLRVLSEDLA